MIGSALVFSLAAKGLRGGYPSCWRGHQTCNHANNLTQKASILLHRELPATERRGLDALAGLPGVPAPDGPTHWLASLWLDPVGPRPKMGRPERMAGKLAKRNS